MLDVNGVELVVGQQVLWRPLGTRDWRRGTVRALSVSRGRKRKECAQIDDGDHDNDDLFTNNFSIAEQVEKPRQIKVRTKVKP